eukprot:scaffold137_cov398-Prasinococcus_capsulatus_cf.AAC.1
MPPGQKSRQLCHGLPVMPVEDNQVMKFKSGFTVNRSSAASHLSARAAQLERRCYHMPRCGCR